MTQEKNRDLEFTTAIIAPDETRDLISLRRYQLIVISKDGNRRKHELGKKKVLRLGKKTDNDIVINDKTVSRYHFEIALTDDNNYLLKDTNSTNGTAINGMKVKEAYLSQGDLIEIGETKIEFQTYDESVQIEPSTKNEFGEMVGKSRKMRQIFGILERISQSQATVIIEGETGTGKELVARAIHSHSSRSNKPFIVFDCSAVAPNLIESELFGHTKGSFTGALKDRMGAFEAAGGGTIFLDEIGELTLDLQPKLLRALESREIKRVGSTRSINLDVRVISATNRNLKEEVKINNFREDLYYRLSVVKIQIPSLRERLEDIPIIVERILSRARFNRKSDGSFYVARVEDDALKMLQRYQWPGNVRELNNILERAVSFSEDGLIKGAHLQYVFSEVETGEEATVRLQGIAMDRPFKEAKQAVVEEFEKEYLQDLLQRNNGNVSKAAREAKIDRKHLRNLLLKYDIIRSDMPDGEEE
ncbi:MAG: sigma 54-interacting transcriptional regulator [bacterium]|nr:sigma 54-interacting transcriptional regulator [bacterium]MBU1916971.1 sigma 54-interacting transcriptional regulator [bacterium]